MFKRPPQYREIETPRPLKRLPVIRIGIGALVAVFACGWIGFGVIEQAEKVETAQAANLIFDNGLVTFTPTLSATPHPTKTPAGPNLEATALAINLQLTANAATQIVAEAHAQSAHEAELQALELSEAQARLEKAQDELIFLRTAIPIKATEQRAPTATAEALQADFMAGTNAQNLQWRQTAGSFVQAMIGCACVAVTAIISIRWAQFERDTRKKRSQALQEMKNAVVEEFRTDFDRVVQLTEAAIKFDGEEGRRFPPASKIDGMDSKSWQMAVNCMKICDKVYVNRGGAADKQGTWGKQRHKDLMVEIRAGNVPPPYTYAVRIK